MRPAVPPGGSEAAWVQLPRSAARSARLEHTHGRFIDLEPTAGGSSPYVLFGHIIHVYVLERTCLYTYVLTDEAQAPCRTQRDYLAIVGAQRL